MTQDRALDYWIAEFLENRRVLQFVQQFNGFHESNFICDRLLDSMDTGGWDVKTAPPFPYQYRVPFYTQDLRAAMELVHKNPRLFDRGAILRVTDYPPGWKVISIRSSVDVPPLYVVGDVSGIHLNPAGAVCETLRKRYDEVIVKETRMALCESTGVGPKAAIFGKQKQKE
jgi:hypothetical protein